MKCIVILGLHRSASSLIAMGLHNANVSMRIRGFIRPTLSNIWGHYECNSFVALNKKILLAAGGSWDNPPKRKAILGVEEAFRNEIAHIVQEAVKVAKEKEVLFWGWKDPRNCLTIRLFHPHIKMYDPHYVVTLRNPEEIAASLWKRNEMKRNRALAVTGHYLKEARSFLDDFMQGKL